MDKFLFAVFINGAQITEASSIEAAGADFEDLLRARPGNHILIGHGQVNMTIPVASLSIRVVEGPVKG